MEDTPDFAQNQIQELSDKLNEKDNKIELIERTLKERTNALKEKTLEADELQYSLRENSKKLAKKEEDYQNMKNEYEVAK